MAQRNGQDIITVWNKKAESVLLGRKIVNVRYMLDEELEATGFYNRCIVIQLDDGTLLYPSADDEGNDAGAIHYQKKGDTEWILPVI